METGFICLDFLFSFYFIRINEALKQQFTKKNYLKRDRKKIPKQGLKYELICLCFS